VYFACFVGYAVFRAGNGCFGLAIQNNCAVHGFDPFAQFALRACLTQERLYPINRMGEAKRPKQAIIFFAKSNMPIQPFCFALTKHMHIKI